MNKAILFGHTLSHLKFEIHVVMDLSQGRLQTPFQNINSSGSNALMALKGRWEMALPFFYFMLNPKQTYGYSDQPILDLSHLSAGVGLRVPD